MRTIEEITKEIKLYDDYIALAEARRAELQSSIKRIQAELPFEKTVLSPAGLEMTLLLGARRALDIHTQYISKNRACLERELAELQQVENAK